MMDTAVCEICLQKKCCFFFSVCVCVCFDFTATEFILIIYNCSIRWLKQVIDFTGFAQIFGSKIQDFFQTFFQTIIRFSRLKVITEICDQ